MMSLVIDNNTLQSAHLSEQEMKTEIAVMLYQQERLTLAQAAHWCGLSRFQFQHCLASKNININYDIEEFEQDIATLKQTVLMPYEALKNQAYFSTQMKMVLSGRHITQNYRQRLQIS